MALPPRVFFTLYETSVRWDCSIADIAGWAAVGKLKIKTGIGLVRCGEAVFAGQVDISAMDLLPLFRRSGTVPAEGVVRRIMPPDWMPGVVPRCVPVETRCNQHGERSTTVVVGTERVLSRGKWRTVEVLACPVTWRPHPEQIASARRGYEDWWRALDWVRNGLVAGGMLHEAEVTG